MSVLTIATITACAADADDVDERVVVLETPCFTLDGDVELPENYIAFDASPNDGQCSFVFQGERADTSVIAGELWSSSSGKSFDDIVAFVESGLEVGQEPDLLPLQLLNTGPSGNPLAVIDRNEIDRPNRAVVLHHESDRRDGFQAYSAVIDVGWQRDDTTTAILMWGLATQENIDLFPAIIEHMQINPDFVPNLE